MEISADAAHAGHNISAVSRYFQQWFVEHSHTRRVGSGRPRSSDARQERGVVRAEVDVSREEIRAHVAPVVSPRTIGNCLLAAGLRSCVPVARLLLTPRHRQAQILWCCERDDWRVEWRSVVFSDERRFCMYASDGVDLVSMIFQSTLAHDFMAWETMSYNLRLHFGVSAG